VKSNAVAVGEWVVLSNAYTSGSTYCSMITWIKLLGSAVSSADSCTHLTAWWSTKNSEDIETRQTSTPDPYSPAAIYSGCPYPCPAYYTDVHVLTITRDDIE